MYLEWFYEFFIDPMPTVFIKPSINPLKKYLLRKIIDPRFN